MCSTVQQAAVSAESRGDVKCQQRGHRGPEVRGFSLNKHIGHASNFRRCAAKEKLQLIRLILILATVEEK